jgi:RimJ/RimL family protein N-acetyltransferase
MNTRAGHAGDFDALAPMLQEQRLRRRQRDPGLYEPHPDAERRFRRWAGEVAGDPRASLLVAEDQGRVVGFLLATVERDPPIYLHDEFGLVREWWVDPAHPDAARALLRHAAADLAAAGIHQLRVRTAADEADARALLHGCGFVSGACEMVMPLRPRRRTPQAARRSGVARAARRDP